MDEASELADSIPPLIPSATPVFSGTGILKQFDPLWVSKTTAFGKPPLCPRQQQPPPQPSQQPPSHPQRLVEIDDEPRADVAKEEALLGPVDDDAEDDDL